MGSTRRVLTPEQMDAAHSLYWSEAFGANTVAATSIVVIANALADAEERALHRGRIEGAEWAIDAAFAIADNVSADDSTLDVRKRIEDMDAIRLVEERSGLRHD